MFIGKYNILQVKRQTDNGIYLTDEAGNEVLLPKKFVTDKMKEGTLGKVFVYTDSEDRPVATTQQPKVTVDEVAYLTVKQATNTGAFLDWGLDKDLLLPFSEQKKHVEAGEMVLVYAYLDKATNRVVATANLNKFIKNRDVKFYPNTEVEIFVCDETEAGFKVIVNGKHWGMLYRNEIFGKVTQGERMKAFVKKVRDDSKIDVALQKQGLTAAQDFTQLILTKLAECGGKLALSDDSTPEEIYAALGISKKNFKKATGMLYKQKKILLENGRILLKK
ncbi:MAG: RNA-binding protein [Chitinophagales bacterium]|nr:RNA-binding protein [Chitinophagales bacterium]